METENQKKEPFIRLENISKSFGNVVANSNVNLDIYRGEILSLLGENGSGKTTLMNMLAGIYFPDCGTIYIDGKPAVITSPRESHQYNIGMIHQHFKLIDVFDPIENIILGIKPERNFFQRIVDRIKKQEKPNPASKKQAKKAVKAILDKYGFKLDLSKKVFDMSVSEKQTLEIVKAIYRGADLLILDEPTAVLTPVEIQHLFNVLRNMKKDGKSIIIITHKLNEVMEISDRVAVLRKGEFIGSVSTASTDEDKLTEMMVGKKVELNIHRDEPKDTSDRLIVKNLNCRNEEGVFTLKNVSFTARSGEILGIAGISGSGQKEILESIAGLVRDDSGEITYLDPTHNDEPVNLKDKTPAQIRELGVRLSFVPEDRLGMGLVGNMDIVDNMMLRSYRRGKLMFVDRNKPKMLADEIIDELEVKTPSVNTAVRKLSGGNVQKVLVGREIAAAPKVLMVAYPVRGLDINSSYTIYNLLNEQKKKGVAVIYVGEDLDVLIALCDRIAVIGSGSIQGIVDARKTDKNEIGRLMTANEVKQND